MHYYVNRLTTVKDGKVTNMYICYHNKKMAIADAKIHIMICERFYPEVNIYKIPLESKSSFPDVAESIPTDLSLYDRVFTVFKNKTIRW